MRISKIIVALLVSVMALTVMTGVAAAAAIQATDINGVETQTFNPGEKVYATGFGLIVDNSVDVYVTQNVSWTDGDKIADAGVVLVRVGVTSAQVTNTLELGDVSNDGGTYDIPFPGKYDVLYDAGQDGFYNKLDDPVDYVGCSGFDTVPEFATIAIPAIAVLGLFLFFNKRKHKKD